MKLHLLGSKPHVLTHSKNQGVDVIGCILSHGYPILVPLYRHNPFSQKQKIHSLVATHLTNISRWSWGSSSCFYSVHSLLITIIIILPRSFPHQELTPPTQVQLAWSCSSQSHGLLLGLRRAGRQSQQLRPSEAGCGRVGRGDLGVGMATGVLPGMGWGRATLGRSQQKMGKWLAFCGVIPCYTHLYSICIVRNGIL